MSLKRTPTNTTKRTLVETSPDLTNTSKRNMPEGSGMVANMSKKDLLDAIGDLMDGKLINVATKDDIARLQEEVVAVKSECDALRLEVKSLQENNEMLRKKLEESERRDKAFNLIFKGIPEENISASEAIKKFCEETLGTGKIAVRNSYRFGRKMDNRARPIVAEFMLHEDVQLILNRKKLIKDSNIVVHRDRSVNARNKRNFLLELKSEVTRINNNIKAELQGEQLIINQRAFSCTDELRLTTRQDNAMDALTQEVQADIKDLVEELAKQSTQKMVKVKNKSGVKLD